MKSVAQNLDRLTYDLVSDRVEAALDSGRVLAIIEDTTHKIVGRALNHALEKEISDALGREAHERGAEGQYRNGTRKVSFPWLMGRLTLHKPVLRSATPPSKLLSALRRAGQATVEMLARRIWLRGASTRAVAQELNSAFGTRLHSADVSRITNAMMPEVEAWLSRPLPKDIQHLYLDACYLPAKKLDFTAKQALLVAIGTDTQGRKHALGFLFGDREDKDTWSAFLRDLLNRGLDRKALKIVISDDHKAIGAAVSEVLATPHQICLVHKMRNARARVASKHRGAFLADFKAVYWAKNRDAAFQALGQLKAKWTLLYPKAVEITESNFEQCLTFMSQPENYWKILRSSNLVERFIRELRRRLRPAGAMMAEAEVWKLVWAVGTEQEKRWASHRVHGARKEAQKLKAAA
jgi:transposase-like protein